MPELKTYTGGCHCGANRYQVEGDVRGRIGDFVYLGEVAQYALIVGNTTLKIFERNPRFIDSASRGELFATVAPEDVVVLVD